MKELSGSIVKPEYFSKLDWAKRYLEALKSYKLWARHRKNDNRKWSQKAVLGHIKEEIQELEAGFALDDSENILEELADVSNCCDILAMMRLYR